MKTLHPPLDVIEDLYARPSDGLIYRIALADPSVPPDLVSAIMAVPAFAADVQHLRDAISGPPDSVPIDWRSTEVPPSIQETISRRVAAWQAKRSRVPTAGQIVAIEQVAGPQGSLHWDLPRPIAVLLDVPAVSDEGQEHADIWLGWVVTPESDYATHWDLVLTEGDADGPLDPLVQMVQAWNAVHVYLGSINRDRVLGQLKPACLQAVRAIAEEHLTASEPTKSRAKPGYVGARFTLGGIMVMTGTPLNDTDDPRWRYQEICFLAAEAIKVPARQAMDLRQPLAGWLSDLLKAGMQRLKSSAHRDPRRLSPLSPQLVLGAASESSCELDRIAKLSLVSASPSERRLAIRLVAEEAAKVIHYEDGMLRKQIVLTSERPDGFLILRSDRVNALVVSNLSGTAIYNPDEDENE